jgi:hypothetical protein
LFFARYHRFISAQAVLNFLRCQPVKCSRQALKFNPSFSALFETEIAEAVSSSPVQINHSRPKIEGDTNPLRYVIFSQFPDSGNRSNQGMDEIKEVLEIDKCLEQILISEKPLPSFCHGFVRNEMLITASHRQPRSLPAVGAYSAALFGPFPAAHSECSQLRYRPGCSSFRCQRFRFSFFPVPSGLRFGPYGFNVRLHFRAKKISLWSVSSSPYRLYRLSTSL